MSDRFERQQEMVPAEDRDRHEVLVIGVGAIGRQVALQLAAIGQPNITICDHDTIEEHNVAVQMYPISKTGETKVSVTAEDMSLLTDHADQPETLYRMALSSDILGHGRQVVFCCVDDIMARRRIWGWCKEKNVPLMVDGRMMGELIRILTCTTDTYDDYERTLFAAGDTEQGRCTARSVVYAANVAAGLMLHQYTRYLRGIPCEKDFSFAMYSNEIFYAEGDSS